MDVEKSIVIFHSILRIVLTICITVVAIHFGNAKLLWWYVVPGVLMGISYKNDEEADDEQR